MLASWSGGSSTPNRRWVGEWTSTQGECGQLIRRTRIVCTIGPSSASPAVLKNLLKAGMDVARLNFSHGDHATHRQAAHDVREAAEEADCPVALLGDLQGPKIRTGELETAFQRLVRGRRVFLIGGKREAENEIEVSHP